MQYKSFDRSAYLNKINSNGHDNGNGNGTYVSFIPPVLENTAIEEDEDSIDLRQFLNVVKHRFRLITAVAVGITTLTALGTFTQEPKYQGSFQVLVEPVNKQQTEDNPLSILGGDWKGLDYETQIEVLRSPSVINPIVEKLKQKYPEIEYDELITEKKSPLKIEQVDETKILEISFTDPEREKIQFVLDNLAEAYLTYSLEERRLEVKQGIEFVEKQLPGVRERVDELQERLQNFRQKHNLLDPEQQAGLLSQKSGDFEEKFFEIQVKLNETKSLYANLQQQIGLQPHQAIAASYLSESPRYQNLLNELQQVEVELAKESARFQDANPVVQALQDKRQQLLPLLQQEALRVLGDKFSQELQDSSSQASPSTLRLELNQQYITTANEIEVLEIRYQALERALAQINRLTKQMPVIARQYTDLQRQLTVATESLNRFLEAEEKLQLEFAQQALPWQLIAKPLLKEDPVAPNPPRNLALGLIGGICLGLGVALLAERLDPVFHDTEELKDTVKLPLLGSIPLQKDLQPLELSVEEEKKPVGLPQLQIGDSTISLTAQTVERANTGGKRNWYNASPFLEAFRSLNTNIRLLGSDSPINSIVISSSIPSEGKSTISSHLAQAAAAMGQKVLLIDADLRRPQVHRWMGIQNSAGLSNILATGLDIDLAIQKVPQWDSLSVITAGDIPPDPTRLLSSKRMQDLMEQLKNEGNYDFIIYDTPPILGFADGRILASRTNGVVLVVRMNKTDRSLLKQNIDNLKMSKVSVLGVVANQVNRGSSGSYYYYNHYYAEREESKRQFTK
jgi:capsular exopolysaccharide synthesis family protein